MMKTYAIIFMAVFLGSPSALLRAAWCNPITQVQCMSSEGGLTNTFDTEIHQQVRLETCTKNLIFCGLCNVAEDAPKLKNFCIQKCGSRYIHGEAWVEKSKVHDW